MNNKGLKILVGILAVLFAASILVAVIYKDDMDYMKAREAGTIEAYTAFVEKHPNSEYCENAKKSLDSLSYYTVIRKGTIKEYVDYLRNRPESEYAEHVKQLVDAWDDSVFNVLSQKYDLFFSLNWVRNLASAVVSVYAGKNYLFNQSGVDVTVNPFASSITEKGVANTVTFVENSGYTVKVLNSLLYVLAATEPGTLYFGAIRGSDRTVSPEILAFNECVAFFPYFQDDGGFTCKVFMNGREMSLENFCYYYAEDFVFLTRVKSSERFFPQ